MAEKITSFRYGEGHTRGGQAVLFTAPPDDFDQAKESLQLFRDIRIPVSEQVNVQHGGFSRYSRYQIEQLDYRGGNNEVGGGYYEILKINNPPDDRHPFVSFGYMNTGLEWSQFFAEWESVEAAQAHQEQCERGKILTLRDFKKQAESEEEVEGLIRVVNTGYLSPWFYATGDATLVGDYVFPEDLANDPVFTFGRQFLVPEKKDRFRDEVVHSIKTCMGCVVEEKKPYRDTWGNVRPGQPEVMQYRVVQWHDGTMTEVYPNTPSDMIPAPLPEQDAWVVEAQQRFNEMLAGRVLGFEVEFIDGGKFVGTYVPPPETPKPAPEGDYLAKVTLEDGTILEGWVFEFTPTEQDPNVVAMIDRKYREKGKIPVKIEIPKKKTRRGGKSWRGVYHLAPTTNSED